MDCMYLEIAKLKIVIWFVRFKILGYGSGNYFSSALENFFLTL